MAESGQISRMWNRWKAETSEGCFDEGVKSLDLMNLFTAWLALAALATIACAIALIEYYIFKKMGRKEPTESRERVESLKCSLNSNNPTSFYEKKNAATKSALAKEWFEFAFGSNSK